MGDDWVFREDDSLVLANVPVKSYVRQENGRPQQVRAYSRMWWVPHPAWAQGQQRWVTAGEAQWNERAKAADAREDAADEAAEPKAPARPERGTAADVSPHLGTQDREPHNYLAPDPERLVRPKARDYKQPEDHPFFKKNPMTADNIVKAYDAATSSEKYQGLRWYADAHRLAWALGGGDAELGAKMLSAYSPRTGWPLNMFNAARSLAEGRALGPGEGVIMGQHQTAGKAVLGGADIDTALPSPKTNAFARLLALGEDHPDDPLGQVVIDRHALSAAAGRRLRKEDVEGKGENNSPIGKQPFYEHVADQYRQAARVISEREGQEIAPHQVQAVTWLRQQRLNTDGDLSGEKTNLGLITTMRNHWAAWQQWAKEHGIRTELGTTAVPPPAVTKAEAQGDSRPVTAAEFYEIATRGRDLLNDLENARSPVTGLAADFAGLKDQAWREARKTRGGLLIDAHTGEPLEPDADKYVLTVKPPGIPAIALPDTTTRQEFDAAMDEALVKFRTLLEQSGYHLGVFREDSSIVIDPVVAVGSLEQAQAIAAYTHNVGGAYHVATGQGHYPPHIADE